MTPLRHDCKLLCELTEGATVFVGRRPYIVKKSGRGGMGFVLFLELDGKNAPEGFSVHGIRIALKSVLTDGSDQDSQSVFRRELTVWSGFKHRNIVSLNEILDSEGDGWVAAMNWCPGSLRDRMLETGTDLADSTHILSGIVDGLAYAREKDGVLHLDLKPENILYDYDIAGLMHHNEGDIRQCNFMVGDWGIASIKQPRLNAIAGIPPSHETCKRTFNNMGTVLYMAPERFIRGFRSSIASDIFSLGMIYLELLVGRLPFRRASDPIESLIRFTYLEDANALMEEARVPSPVQRLIRSMISPDPAGRPQSYKALKGSLTSVNLRTKGFFSRIGLSGLFKPKMSSADAAMAKRVSQNPLLQKAMLGAELEFTEKSVANLRAVGRTAEAEVAVKGFLAKAFQRFNEEPQNPSHLSFFTNAAIRLRALETGKGTLEAVIQANEGRPILDLTLVYTDLGRIYHQIRTNPKKELLCYSLAIEAQAPENCTFPATRQQKAKAHQFASWCATRALEMERADFHLSRARELVPEVNWEDKRQVAQLMLSN